MPRIALATLVLAACSKGADPTDPTAPTGEVVSVDIVAAEGGVVESGDASLDIPAGALAEDTTITVETLATAGLPDAGSLVGTAYDFGPDGTTFSTPASLTIDAGATPGPDQSYVIAWLDEASGAWVDLPSTLQGTAVTAPVEHFTTFVVRLVDTIGECSFSPCGGDPVGAWTMAGVCVLEEVPLDELPGAMQDCPDLEYELTLDQTGTYDVLGDGTYTYEVVLDLGFTYTYPAACLSGIPSCEELSNPLLSCSGDAAVECTCTGSISDHDTGGGSWSTSGTTVEFDEDADGAEVDTFDYCVAGDVLTIANAEMTQTFTR